MNRFLRPKTYLFYLQREVKSYKLRASISNLLGMFLKKSTFPENKFVGFEYAPSSLERLCEDGFVEFENRLSDETLDKISAAIKYLDLIDNFNPKLGNFKISAVSEVTNVADYNRADLLRIPEIMAIANDSEILELVQDFLGAVPTISNINMWWSFAGRAKAKDAQLFHRDVDDLKFCKLFIYLTDVGPNDGPHTYVKGSPATNLLTKIRRYEDKEVTDVFGEESVTSFVRPKGSMFIVDTYGFHKGTLPVDNNRLLLQVQYSLLPIFIEQYKPIDVPDFNKNSYVNRLLVK